MPKRNLKSFILERVLKSGLPLENYVSSCLDSKKWAISENTPYLDEDENKSRELDLRVENTIQTKDQNITINLLIQCKKIPGNAWIFPKGKSQIYPDYIVAAPNYEITNYIFNERNTILQKMKYKVTNYMELIFDTNKSNKRDDNLFESIMTLVKATSSDHKIAANYEWLKDLLGTDSKLREGFKRHPSIFFNVFYPIVVFEGKMYLVDFESKSKIKEVPAVLVDVPYKSAKYDVNYSVFVINKTYFKKFIKTIEKDISLFTKNANKKRTEINKELLKIFNLV